VTRSDADDTIAAIATAPGRGALAIVRLSGPQALAIGRQLVTPFPDQPKFAVLARVSEDGQTLDEAIVVFHRGPASFTGEDTLEVTTHGGPISSASVLAAFVAAGARPAEPGEFTRRAVLNGKLDLVQAEAIGDLVDATTRAGQRVALSQLDGGLSRRILRLREKVIELEALCAYDIDFPEEDDGPIPRARILEATDELTSQLDQLLATASLGEVVREGATVVIAGAPNVGKSSLFNALLGRRRAIVADVPGTTRDAIEATTEAEGWPIRLVDTAGLRETSEQVERLGIEVSREYLERADLVLACGDTDETVERARLASESLTRAPVLSVRTKTDLPGAPGGHQHDRVFVSAETGAGLVELTARIAAVLASAKGALMLDAPLVTRERQRAGLERARAEITRFRDAWETETVPAVVVAVHLREAARHLEELIGAIDVDDVLDRLFRAFCVGK
jgi:tRNA modification GTPase